MSENKIRSARLLLVTAMLGTMVAAPLTASIAQEVVEPDAGKVIFAMSEYLGDLPNFSVNYDADLDVLMPDGQKLKLASSGKIVVNRPSQLHVARSGSVADLELVLDGGLLTLYGKKLNGYVQLPAVTIDEAIIRVRDDIGFDSPGADLLSAKPFADDLSGVVSGRHIGMTTIGGVSVHHIAFKGEELDWQIWVKDGDDPLPLKYVITSKLMAGGPEYSLRLMDWNTKPNINEYTFKFLPDNDAKKLSSIAIDQTGNVIGSWD